MLGALSRLAGQTDLLFAICDYCYLEYDHLAIFPNFQLDETMYRETLENLSAERDTQRMLAIELLVAATDHLLRGHDGQLSSAWNC